MYFLANMQYDYILDLDNRLQITQVAELEMQYNDYNNYPDHHAEMQWEYHQEQMQCAPTPTCNIMQPTDFSTLIGRLKNITFEDTRILQYRAAMQYSQLNVDQIATVMNLFHFEDNKMIIAKESFARVCDPQNYYCWRMLLLFHPLKKSCWNTYVHMASQFFNI